MEKKQKVRTIVVERLPEGQDMLLACKDLKMFGLIHPEFPKPYAGSGESLRLPPSSGRVKHGYRGGNDLRRMEDAFHASEVDTEPLSIDKTLFCPHEEDNVEDIPGLDGMPDIIRNILLKHRSVFANELSADRKIKCEPLYLEVKEGVELPPKVRRAQATHHHWRPRAEQIVRKMQKEGILVQVDEVTPAVSVGFFVKKPHGSGIHFMCDYTGVNKVLERNIHHFPAPQQVWQRVTKGSKYFLACDLSAGYWQCELDYESSLLTTCLTEFGKFRFTRLPMGASPSGDLFNQTTDNILEGIKHMVKEVDDILLFSDSIEGIAENLEDMMQRFETNNVTLAPKKLQFGSEVMFAGLRITEDGCTTDPERMDAVRHFPRPETRTQVMQLLGLCQQFAVCDCDSQPQVPFEEEDSICVDSGV